MTPAPKSIQRTFIEAPIETVWATLVATDKPLPFFFGAVCDTTDGLKPGPKCVWSTPTARSPWSWGRS